MSILLKTKKDGAVNIKKYNVDVNAQFQNSSLIVGGPGKGKKTSATELAKTVERITPLKEDRILSFTKKTIDGVVNSLVINAQKANSDEWELFTADTAAVILRMIAERMDEDVTLAEFLDTRKKDVSSNIF